MLYKEAVYLVMDELKANSDDALFTEEHIIFLLGKYRAFLLKQRYADLRKQIPESNYQTICLDLIQVPAISGEPCEGGYYLRSKEKIPFLMKIGVTSVYPVDYYQSTISYIPRDRMKYVGYNKYLQNIIYSSLGVDNYLYLKSSNPQFLYLEKVRMTGIFEDPQKAAELDCCNCENCDIMETNFPLEDALFPQCVELIMKELIGVEYRPTDNENNAHDDMPELANNNARQQQVQ